MFSSIFKNIFPWIKITGGTIDNINDPTDEHGVGVVGFNDKRYPLKISPPTVHTPSAGGTVIINLSVIHKHDIIMPAGNITIAISGSVEGIIFTIKILQDATGSRTVTWFNTIKWAEGGAPPILTTTADKADLFIFSTISENNYDGFIVGQNL